MIELLADFFFPSEAVKEKRVGLHFRMWNLDRDGLAGAQVRAAENGRHPAPGDNAFDAVVIELVAGMKSTHGGSGSAAKPSAARTRVSRVCMVARGTYPFARRLEHE